MNSKRGFKKVAIDPDWATTFYLIERDQEFKRKNKEQHDELVFDKYYDMILPGGAVFEGGLVRADVHTGVCGNMESYSETTGYFVTKDGVEIKLQAGYLLRLNKEVTAKKEIKQRENQRRSKLSELRRERSKLDRKIAKLKN
jgi:hypothetical protein